MGSSSSQGTLVPFLRPGELVAAKYQVSRVLGQGAMGVVVAAIHIELQQEVAIKFMLGNTDRDFSLVERFRREARVSAQIKSEHVVRVMDVGKLDTGAPYIVMELLQGCDLAAELEQRGPLPVREAVDYVLQASEALSEAHALGVVHRDLKPSNFFLQQRRDGSRVLKILDFGISKMSGASSSDASLTATHAVMGSPLYMAPEQIRNSKSVDSRSDIWSLGVIMHELLTGTPPFEAEEVAGLLAAIMTDTPSSVRALNPNLPQEIDALIHRCLVKNRDQRLGSVEELALALKPFASKAGKMVADRISRVPLHPTGKTTALPPSSEPIQIPMQTGFGAAITNATVRSALPWFGSVGVIALAGIAGFFLYSRSSHDPALGTPPLSQPIQSVDSEHFAPSAAAEANSAAVPPEKSPAPARNAESPKVEPIVEPLEKKAVMTPLAKSKASSRAQARPQQTVKPASPATLGTSLQPATTSVAPAAPSPKSPDPALSANPFAGRK